MQIGGLVLTTSQRAVLLLQLVHFPFQFVELVCGILHDLRQINDVVLLWKIVECLLRVLVLRSEW